MNLQVTLNLSHPDGLCGLCRLKQLRGPRPRSPGSHSGAVQNAVWNLKGLLYRGLNDLHRVLGYVIL